VVALSFSKRLVQPIRDRVHPGFEYWDRQDPTQGQNRKVPREEAVNRVARMMQGPIRDCGCPKTHCLKRPTRAVSFLESFRFLFRVVLFLPWSRFYPASSYVGHPLGCNQLGTKSRTTRKRQEDIRLWSAASSSASSGTHSHGSALASCGRPGSRLLHGEPFSSAPGSGPDDPSTQSRGAPYPESATPAAY